MLCQIKSSSLGGLKTFQMISLFRKLFEIQLDWKHRHYHHQNFTTKHWIANSVGFSKHLYCVKMFDSTSCCEHAVKRFFIQNCVMLAIEPNLFQASKNQCSTEPNTFTCEREAKKAILWTQFFLDNKTMAFQVFSI